jgi:hypothetical protein
MEEYVDVNARPNDVDCGDGDGVCSGGGEKFGRSKGWQVKEWMSGCLSSGGLNIDMGGRW